MCAAWLARTEQRLELIGFAQLMPSVVRFWPQQGEPDSLSRIPVLGPVPAWPSVGGSKYRRGMGAAEYGGVVGDADAQESHRRTEGYPRPDPCRYRESSGAEHHTAGAQNLRQPGPQAHEDRERRLPSRPPPRAGPAHRSRRERSSHHGVEKRAPAHARRGFQRKNGRFWSAQFCTEVAHPTRFERVTFAFGEQRSIQLSYGCVPLPLADWGAAARRTGLSRTPKGSFGQCHRSEIRRMAGEAGEGRSAACQLARHHWPGRGQAEKPGWVRSVGPANANRWPADRHDRPAKPWLRHSRDTQSGETAAVPPQWHHLAAPRRTSPADCRSA